MKGTRPLRHLPPAFRETHTHVQTATRLCVYPRILLGEKKVLINTSKWRHLLINMLHANSAEALLLLLLILHIESLTATADRRPPSHIPDQVDTYVGGGEKKEKDIGNMTYLTFRSKKKKKKAVKETLSDSRITPAHAPKPGSA